MRSRAEREVTVANEKIVKLSEHIEKLMVHLKHESTDKMKIQKTANRLEREVKSLTSRTSVLSRKNAERERIVAQLREGSEDIGGSTSTHGQEVHRVTFRNSIGPGIIPKRW